MSKAIYGGINGTARKGKSIYAGVNGIARKVTKAYIGDSNGIARLFWSNGITLANISEGSIVKINENGSPVEFYVAKHNYESGLNGAGRTLLYRKEPLPKMEWVPYSRSSSNDFSNSDLCAYLNGSYKNRFDTTIKSLISTTKFYNTTGITSKYQTLPSTTLLSKSVFICSGPEYGEDRGKEGTTLPIASLLKNNIPDNGVDSETWTRSPLDYNFGIARDAVGVLIITKSYRSCDELQRNDYEHRNKSYPVFTFPSNALFDPSTMRFIG